MMPSTLSRLLFGTDPKLRRMLSYWGATALLYLVFILLVLQVADRRLIDHGAAVVLSAYGVGGIVVSYLLVRFGARLGLAPTVLSAIQAVFAISCNMWLYSIAGPLRGATLMGLMLVVVFCTFALRPRQTLALAGAGLAGMGATMWWHQAHDPLHYPPMVEAVTFAIMAICSLAVTLITGEMSKLRARLKAQKEELMKAVETIRTLATVDELTALANRRHMNEVLAQEERRRGQGCSTCIALLDIDFFKQINDRHGHAAGDEVLRSFAAAARAELRAGDVLARWGGEEFLLLLPDTGEAEALKVVERIRARVGGLRIAGLDGADLPDGRRVSFSAGLTPRRGAEVLADTVNRADKALYQAKSAGRDRVVTA
ncbi:diguanylate cyclase [Massilia sp. LXY-6]|uniref:diguanylate cyclase n=1 Tax=Massilia sp. LXY-6 TaxID=3379823 RepID=UPI003EE1080D